jgi:ATP-binding cassette subfamily B protein
VYEHHLFITTLFDFLAYKPQIVAPAHPVPLDLSAGSDGLNIEFRNVSFIYPGKSEPALKNISFALHPGESIALVGQNGAGKTTLVKLLTRLYEPTEGEILVGGCNIKDYDPSELREQIGVTFQDYVKYCIISAAHDFTRFWICCGIFVTTILGRASSAVFNWSAV